MENTFVISNKKMARTAGFLYLFVVLSGIFSLAYVPQTLIVKDDITKTFNNILASETLFRLGILSSLICYIFFIFLPLSLYKLLKPVNLNHAVLMVILAIVSVPISFINMQHHFAVLSLINGANEYLKVYNQAQLLAQVKFHLDMYTNGIQIVQIFWGLWLFPFGYLVFKSGFLPKILGILLMLGCLGYLVEFVGELLINKFNEIAITSYISIPGSLGEIGTCLWLLIMGAKEKTSA